MTTLRTILGELRRRRFPAIIAIYCAGGFALLETIDDLSGRFAWPGEVFDIALTVLLLGIMNVAIAAWFHGAENAQRWDRRELSLHCVPVLLAALFLGWRLLPDSGTETLRDPNCIRFMGFSPGPGESAGEPLGDSLSLDIARMLSGTASVRIEQTTAGNAATLLSGRTVSDRGKTRISVELSDAGSGIQLWSERFECDSAMSTDDRQMIASRIAASVTETLREHFREE